MAARKRKTVRKPRPPHRVDVDTTNSQHRGLFGIYERLLRRFKTGVYLVTLIPLYGLGSAILGLGITPGAILFFEIQKYSEPLDIWIRLPLICWALASGYFIYGFTMILVLPLVNQLVLGHVKELRGPYFSIGFLPWYVHNGLTYIARYTFLDLMTPTPMNIWFYQLMGMKIGRGCQINSTNISDPGLISLGEKVTIGGSATLAAHYGMGGFLILAPVKIGNRVTIGLRAIVMGGVEIGDEAKVLPNSVVLPKTKIGKGETWGGVPARKLDLSKE